MTNPIQPKFPKGTPEYAAYEAELTGLAEGTEYFTQVAFSGGGTAYGKNDYPEEQS